MTSWSGRGQEEAEALDFEGLDTPARGDEEATFAAWKKSVSFLVADGFKSRGLFDFMAQDEDALATHEQINTRDCTCLLRGTYLEVKSMPGISLVNCLHPKTTREHESCLSPHGKILSSGLRENPDTLVEVPFSPPRPSRFASALCAGSSFLGLLRSYPPICVISHPTLSWAQLESS
jgi:hypothetical protein